MALEVSNGRLRERIQMHEDMIYAAFTGEGLEEIRENQFYRQIAGNVFARRHPKKINAIPFRGFEQPAGDIPMAEL